MSTLVVSNISDGTTTVGASYVTNGSAKAWVRVNTSAAIVDSFNTASITDNGAGDNTSNFTSSMANASFSTAGCMNYNNNGIVWVFNQSTGAYSVRTYIPTANLYADLEWGASVHGDLA